MNELPLYQAGYFTVVIPYVAVCPTEWHPTDENFAPLTRGAFATIELANEWAQRELGGHPYDVRFIAFDYSDSEDSIATPHIRGLWGAEP
jgi:hypothetical protein